MTAFQLTRPRDANTLISARGQYSSLDLTTNKTRPLTKLIQRTNPAAMRTFDITPDGKEIIFDRLQENSDIVLIERPK